MGSVNESPKAKGPNLEPAVSESIASENQEKRKPMPYSRHAMQYVSNDQTLRLDMPTAELIETALDALARENQRDMTFRQRVASPQIKRAEELREKIDQILES